MDAVLYIDDVVVTEKVLGRAHKGERIVCVGEKAIVTPTARDYVRQHKLELVQGEVGQRLAAIGGVAQEVDCEHPQQSYGCEKEEFGSGYAAPGCCDDCAIRALQLQGKSNSGCEGCNLHKTGCDHSANEEDALVQQITNLVIDMLEGKGK